MRKLLLLIGIIILFGCKKEGESLPYTEVYGKVISRGNQLPIDSVRVSIWDGMPDDRLLGSNKVSSSHNYDTTYTDKDGNFHIGIYGNEPVLYLYKKGYEFKYSYGGAALGIAPLNSGKIYKNEIFNLDAEAYFNPVFINKISVLKSDSLVIYVPTSIPIHYLGEGPHRYRFSDPDGAICLGDSFTKFRLEFQINGNWSYKEDSIYLKALQHYTDTIYY
jgi:hypothetical protein